MDRRTDGRGRPDRFTPRAGPQLDKDDDYTQDWQLSRLRRLRAQALAETSAAFTSSGPSSRAAFQAMAARLAIRLQGGCMIRPCDPATTEHVPVVADHARPQARQSLSTLVRTSPEALGSAYCAWVAERGRSILTPQVAARSLRRWTDQAAWSYLAENDIFTFLVVPVRAAERIVGTLSLWREQPGQPLDEDDQLFAEEVGRRLIPS